jgi:hypothetical protein
MVGTAAAVCFAVAVLPPSETLALRGDDYELASLIFDSHAVVLNQRNAQRRPQARVAPHGKAPGDAAARGAAGHCSSRGILALRAHGRGQAARRIVAILLQHR